MFANGSDNQGLSIAQRVMSRKFLASAMAMADMFQIDLLPLLLPGRGRKCQTRYLAPP